MKTLLVNAPDLDLDPYAALLERAGLPASLAAEDGEALWLLAAGGYRAVVVDLSSGPLLWQIVEAALWGRPPARVIGLVRGTVPTALRRRAYGSGVWEVIELPEGSGAPLHAGVVSAVRRAVGSAMTPSVLHVDGCAGLTEGIGALIADEGCLVDGAGSPAEAARRMQAKSYDLILTEIRRFGVEGFQVLREAAALQPGVPVIALAATLDDDTFLRSIELGARTCLWKLADPEEILAEVRALLATAPLHGRRQG